MPAKLKSSIVMTGRNAPCPCGSGKKYNFGLDPDIEGARAERLGIPPPPPYRSWTELLAEIEAYVADHEAR
jgi:hypothetical protein